MEMPFSIAFWWKNLSSVHADAKGKPIIHVDFTEDQIDHIEHLLAQVINQEERVA